MTFWQYCDGEGGCRQVAKTEIMIGLPKLRECCHGISKERNQDKVFQEVERHDDERADHKPKNQGLQIIDQAVG